MKKAIDVRRVVRFIVEREAIRLKKESGAPKPWTQDKILRNYRFTCVRREDDKVTRWIAANWRMPFAKHEHLWFAMCVARYINWPATLELLEWPVPWKRVTTLARLKQQAARGQVFGGAYFLNSIGPKIESIVNDRLTPLWEKRKEITDSLGRALTLQQMYEVFHSQFGFGSFMAGQIVADLKYVGRYRTFADWETWAVSGPGSKRGLNRHCGLPVNSPWRESVWHATLLTLRERINHVLVHEYGWEPLHAQDIQGIACCEYDKMERARLGEGRPKTKYNGG